MKPSDWPSPTVAARHAAMTDRSGGADACWPWLGRTNEQGYGQMTVGSSRIPRTAKAHRVAYVVAFGEIPDGLSVDHTCYSASCQNPAHMRLLTVGENSRRQRHLNHHRGERTPTAKLSEASVRLIRRAYTAGAPSRELACKYGVTSQTILAAVRGYTWAHVAQEASVAP